ncbi:MAG: FtsX-like permease family protein [Gemmataceae bacterium]|nr:FtsX-like permease family protein [Gemmataceae bacterium]
MTPLGLAWSNIAHKRTRTAVAAAGVAFAVALIFMEIGMFGGVRRTATMLYDALRFDLIVTSSEYTDVSRPGEFSRARLARAESVDGVADVLPLSVGVGTWRKPARQGLFGRIAPGGLGSINLLGVPPGRAADVFAVDRGRVFPSRDEGRTAGEKLARLGAFLYDVRSKPEFGSLDDLLRIPEGGEPGADPNHPEVRNAIRLNGKRAEVVGGFELGTGFSWNGMLMCNEETFADYTMQRSGRVTFGLVTLRPGADIRAVQRELRTVLPGDVRVLTRDEVNEQERRYWMELTSVGQFLSVAVALAIVVGVIFVYQMMAADIRGMLPEYATVKALGYRPPYLSGVVLWQAVLLAVLGYVPGLVASFGMYYVASTVGGIPTAMTAERAVVVLLMTCAMCFASGLLAVRKVHSADPADLF